VVADVRLQTMRRAGAGPGLAAQGQPCAPNSQMPSAIPPAICSFQSGKLLMGMPGGYSACAHGIEQPKIADRPRAVASQLHRLEQVTWNSRAGQESKESPKTHPGLMCQDD